MPITVFSNSTTAYADQVYDNYIYTGQGNLLPMSPTSAMENTSSVFDIGSTSYKWNKIYSNSIMSIQSIWGPSWYLLAEEFSTATTRVEVTADFSLYKEFFITGISYLFVNGDSAVGSHIYEFFTPNAAGAVICSATTSTPPSTYYPRDNIFLSNNGTINFLSVFHIPHFVLTGRYVTSSTITSLVFETQMNATVKVFAR